MNQRRIKKVQKPLKNNTVRPAFREILAKGDQEEGQYSQRMTIQQRVHLEISQDSSKFNWQGV